MRHLRAKDKKRHTTSDGANLAEHRETDRDAIEDVLGEIQGRIKIDPEEPSMSRWG